MSVPVLLGLFALLGAARSDGGKDPFPAALERTVESAPCAKRDADDPASHRGEDEGEERPSSGRTQSEESGETRDSSFASHGLRASVEEGPQPTHANRSGTLKLSRLHALGRAPMPSLRGAPFPRLAWISLPDSLSPLSPAARAPHAPRGPPVRI